MQAEAIKEKRSVSSRIDSDVYDVIETVGQTKGHRFYDRKVAYVVSHVLKDWAKGESLSLGQSPDPLC